MIIVLGSVVVRDGEFEKALVLSQEHVARSRREPGCVVGGLADAVRPGRALGLLQDDGEPPRPHSLIMQSASIMQAASIMGGR